MYSPKFIAELFKPQQVYTNRSTRQIFDRLAHSSIMRLNENSMDKLYDLMTMGFKYQMLCCTSPTHLLQVTLNHLEALRRIVDNKAVSDLIDNAMRLTNKAYGSLSVGEFFALRHVLCRFFQDRRVKVSLFLQDGIQNLDGTIVLDMRGPIPIGSDAPGTARYFGSDGSARTTHIPALAVDGATAPNTGDPTNAETRPCKLGANMYSKDRKSSGGARKPKPGPDAGRHAKGGTGKSVASSSGAGPASSESKGGDSGSGSGSGSASSSAHATAGLNLLASLLGTSVAATEGGASASEGKSGDGGGSGGTFKLNLFAEDPFSGGGGGGGREAASQVIMIDARDRESLEELMGKLDMGDGDGDGDGGGGGKAAEDDDDLLALMDSAA